MSYEHDRNSNVVERLNAFLRSMPWCDFTIASLAANRLVIEGGIDVFSRADVRVTFSGLYHLDAHMDWHAETKDDSFSIVAGDEAKELNQLYEIEAGNELFRIRPEDFHRSFVVAAQSIDFEVLNSEPGA